MTFTVGLHLSAQRDVYNALTYYNSEAPEQSVRFIAELVSAAERLAHFPFSTPELRGNARVATLRVFPYQLWYSVSEEAQTVEILAVLHHRQDAMQFNDRLL